MATIWTFPGDENAGSNPFTATLVRELRALGHAVSAPSWRHRLSGTSDIIHLHWPQKVIQPSLARSLRSFALWYAFLRVQKMRGARIVWTVHNVRAHEGHRTELERRWMEALIGLLDGIHAMSRVGLEEACQRYPGLKDKAALLAPHWTYGEAYPPPAPGLHSTGLGTIAFLGDLKAYKGLDRFLAALEQGVPDDQRYLIHGRPEDTAAAQDLARRVNALQQAGWNLECVAERLSDQEMADRLAETGLLVLPYHSGENSGLAVLAAERGTPLLVSPLPAFEPLLAELGPPRVTAFDDPLTHATMRANLDRSSGIAGRPPHEFVAARAPQRVVLEISNYYQFLMES